MPLSFFLPNQPVDDLGNFIQSNLDRLPAEKRLGPSVKMTTSRDQATPSAEDKEQAAKVIQRFFRGYKIKEKIVKSPYFAYLSTIGKEDDSRLLSEIMFGRHQAEFGPYSKERLSNPYLHGNPLYHRDDNLSGPLLDNLISEFGISDEQQAQCEYIPITRSENTPISDYLATLKTRYPAEYSSIKLIPSANHSIFLLELPKKGAGIHKIKAEISASGYVATPWEIASNIKQIDRAEVPSSSPPIKIDPRMPSTKEMLLSSEIMSKLNSIAQSKHHATNQLARSLKQLLIDMPELSPDAMQRISMMLDITHMFYANNYSRYTFCVYTIIHEISLAIAKEQSPEKLAQDYADFQTEAKQTLSQSFGMERDLEKATYFASPAMSGTNAYTIAINLAKKMQTDSGNAPTIRVIEPSYYEFGFITQSSDQSDADIFAISTGPVVNPEGLVPGIDINRFVKRNIIDTQRSKPTTIIIDATTTLYSSLNLNDETKALIKEGKLSIIIHESHQKFGLLHTDQAQYGRIFGLCSTDSYTKESVQEIERKGQADFNSHIDMRIGAFISVTCQDTLEEIKKQHFRNGAILRNILSQIALLDADVVTHEDMLTNLDELYFFASTSPQLRRIIENIVEFRASFGHFHTAGSSYTGQTRVAPGASDDIDCLIETAQIYLAHYYKKPSELMTMIIANGQQQRDAKPLPLNEQIIAVAALSNICATINRDRITSDQLINLYASMSNIVDQCPMLRGRPGFTKIERFLLESKEQIIALHKPVNPHDFMADIRKVYNNTGPIHSDKSAVFEPVHTAIDNLKKTYSDMDKSNPKRWVFPSKVKSALKSLPQESTYTPESIWSVLTAVKTSNSASKRLYSGFARFSEVPLIQTLSSKTSFEEFKAACFNVYLTTALLAVNQSQSTAIMVRGLDAAADGNKNTQRTAQSRAEVPSRTVVPEEQIQHAASPHHDDEENDDSRSYPLSP